MREDDNDRFRAERAADLRERDRQREPHRHPRCIRPSHELQERHARMVDTTIVRLSCPACSQPVFVPRDAGETRATVNCAFCEVSLTAEPNGDGISLIASTGASP